MKTRSDIAKAQEKLGQNAQVILTVNLWNNSRSGIEKKVDGNRKTFDDATKSRKSKMHFQQTSNPVGLNVTGRYITAWNRSTPIGAKLSAFRTTYQKPKMGFRTNLSTVCRVVIVRYIFDEIRDCAV